MNRRIFGNEFYLGTSIPLAIVMLLSLCAALFLQPWWAGSWNDLTMVVRSTLSFTLPLVAMAGTWTAAREHRCGTRKLLTTAPRPDWQPFFVSWAALTLGATIGMAAAWAIAAVFVFPIATGSNGSWVAALLVCAPAYGAGAAFGMALGRLVRWRLIVLLTPALAYLVFTAFGWVSWRSGYDTLFVILASTRASYGEMYSLSSSLLQGLWFAAGAATFLVLAVSRLRWRTLLPPALAAALTLLISAIPVERHVVADPVAMREVCTSEAPKICVAGYKVHVLGQLARFGQPMLEKLRGIPGAPAELRFESSAHPILPVYTGDTTITGRLADPVHARDLLGGILASTPHCDGESFGRASEAAWRWLVNDAGGTARSPGRDHAPDREWMTAYYAARADCDTDAAWALLERL